MQPENNPTNQSSNPQPQPSSNTSRTWIIVAIIAGVALLVAIAGLAASGTLKNISRGTNSTSFTEKDELGITQASIAPTTYMGYPLSVVGKFPDLANPSSISVPSTYTSVTKEDEAANKYAQIMMSYDHKTLDDYKQYLGQLKAMGYKLNVIKSGDGTSYITETQLDGKKSIRIDYHPATSGLAESISMSYDLPVGQKMAWPDQTTVPYTDPIAFGIAFKPTPAGEKSWMFDGEDAQSEYKSILSNAHWTLNLSGYDPSMKDKLHAYFEQPQFEKYQLYTEDSDASEAGRRAAAMVGDTYKIYGQDDAGHRIDMSCHSNTAFGPTCVFDYYLTSKYLDD